MTVLHNVANNPGNLIFARSFTEEFRFGKGSRSADMCLLQIKTKLGTSALDKSDFDFDFKCASRELSI